MHYYAITIKAADVEILPVLCNFSLSLTFLSNEKSGLAYMNYFPMLRNRMSLARHKLGLYLQMSDTQVWKMIIR